MAVESAVQGSDVVGSIAGGKRNPKGKPKSGPTSEGIEAVRISHATALQAAINRVDRSRSINLDIRRDAFSTGKSIKRKDSPNKYKVAGADYLEASVTLASLRDSKRSFSERLSKTLAGGFIHQGELFGELEEPVVCAVTGKKMTQAEIRKVSKEAEADEDEGDEGEGSDEWESVQLASFKFLNSEDLAKLEDAGATTAGEAYDLKTAEVKARLGPERAKELAEAIDALEC